MFFPNVKVQPHWLATLERAVEMLPNVRWVCSALDNGVELKIEGEVRSAISEAIAPFNTVNSWLICKVSIDLATKAEAQEYRTAWLNQMVEQCRSMQPKEIG